MDAAVIEGRGKFVKRYRARRLAMIQSTGTRVLGEAQQAAI
jgi:hypothetical protein